MSGSCAHVARLEKMQQTATEADSDMDKPKDLLTSTDSRTGNTFELPITDDTIPAIDLRAIKVNEGDFGMLSYDPGLTNTVIGRSSICFIDGDKGILEYRGYSIEELASKGTYLEICWLVLNGELPTASELDLFEAEVRAETMIPENIEKLTAAMNPEMHPMSMLEAALAALGGEFPEADEVLDAEVRHQQIIRLVALTPILAALGHRHREGLGPVEVKPELSYVGNFLHMLLSTDDREAALPPVLEKAMDALLVLHAEHEQNCSANAVRAVGSSHVNPYSAVAAGAAALHGPLHGGANQAVLEMLDTIDSVEDVPAFLESCKNGERRLMGFGHRVYKNYDPRAKVIGDLAGEVFAVSGPNPKLEIARELERLAVEDPYFAERKLFPNVDFYSGLIYAAMGFKPRMFTVFFAVARMIGWVSHWEEMMADPKTRIVRPRQIYTGYDRRSWVPMDQR
ncbi:MAG: citrate/2-methylcitrate synthase [Planctomycetota bacterium]